MACGLLSTRRMRKLLPLVFLLAPSFANAQTIYIAPPPVPYAPPAPPVHVPGPPPVEIVVQRAKPVPQWTSKIGLGVRGTGQVINNGWDNLGIGGELLYRASPHLVTELAAEYQRSPDGPLDRTDIPVTLGLRLH